MEERLGGLSPLPSLPLSNLLSVHQLQGRWPEHRGSSWLSASGELGACDFETWPFSVLFVQKRFHPGSLQWLLRIRRTPGRLGYRTALQAVLGNLKRACFSLSDFKLTFFSPFLNEFLLLQTPPHNPLVYFCDFCSYGGD